MATTTTAAAGGRARALLAPTSPRNTELGLLGLVFLVTVAAYVLATLGRTASIPANIIPFLAFLLTLLLIAHLATRRFAPNATPVMLPLAGFLNGIGYVFIARLDSHLAGLQATWTAIGVAGYVLTLAFVRRIQLLERYRYLIATAGVVLLLMPLAPGVGERINGARLWVRLGPLSFQPVELAKIGLAVFFASYLVEKRELLANPTSRVGNVLLPDPRPFGPLLLMWGLSMLVMTAERDVGFSLLIFVLFISMLWISTGRATYLLVSLGLFVLGAGVMSVLLSQVHERITVWLNPWPYASGIGYQAIQALYAMGSGGVAGTGLGLGRPTLIPVVASDYIFAGLGEELGLVGTTIIVAAFVLLITSGLRTAIRARSDFAKLLTAGLTAVLGFQAFFIMAGVLRLLPVTGVTLPFVAYGGSSLVANYILIALIARVSDEAAPVVS
ncbi:MAG TPA: FtsW/RodA/SpoVE family cell cycle protein [Acidimicrobiales bacterium]|nr:FtsW/RodA/SpoVE family cell cycle protein [Acidimicrobiales bacterium]